MREIKDFKLLRKGDRVRYCNNGICKDGIVIAGGKKGESLVTRVLWSLMMGVGILFGRNI